MYRNLSPLMFVNFQITSKVTEEGLVAFCIFQLCKSMGVPLFPGSKTEIKIMHEV